MAAVNRPPMVIALLGTSLTTGRLASPPYPWARELWRHLMARPECVGQLYIHEMGKGSQTSDWLATQSAIVSGLRPTHCLFEGGAINDCAIGPVSLAQAATNFNTIVANLRNGNPNIRLCHQTMSPASAGDASRANLFDYYAQELSRAAANNVPSLNHTPNWPSPLPVNITDNLDGLHPIWSNGTQGFGHFSFPAILTWAVTEMGLYWPS